jgi:hypothetical protein
VVGSVRFEINRLFQWKTDDAIILGWKIRRIVVRGGRIAIVGRTKVCGRALGRYTTLRGRKQVAEGRPRIIETCMRVTRSRLEFGIHCPGNDRGEI